jgi:pimeloyl-ACP methyl ester carboxylesterase
MKIGRRSWLTAGAAVAATSVIADARAAVNNGKKATYVLVHGGGHGGWCWERVATPLREQGHRVYTPTLTGLGERSHLLHPDIDLDTQITDVINTLKWEDLKDVILVGHSYGGMVITGVADRAPAHVGQLVYLDAAHPKNGDPLFKRPNTSGGSAGAGGPSAFIGTKMVNGVELMLFPDDALIKVALGVTNPADMAWLKEKLTPHPAKCFFQPLRLENEAALKNIPTTDIWRSMILKQLDPDGSRRATMANRVWEINSPCHDLMVSDPRPVTEMLRRLAAL